jgi:hypothetical protein
MRYRLHTLLIVLAMGPPFIWISPAVIGSVREAYWDLTTRSQFNVSLQKDQLSVNGRSYGRVKPDDEISRIGNRLYVNGELRKPE